MSRCLSEKTLLRLIAGSGSQAQRAHLAACRRCGVRYRAILRDFDRTTDVLLYTAPPRWSPSLLTRYRLPARASAMAAIVVLIWVVSTVWRDGAPSNPEEVTAFLADVSSAMFSTHDALDATDDTGSAATYGLTTGCSSDSMGILGCEGDNENGRAR